MKARDNTQFQCARSNVNMPFSAIKESRIIKIMTFIEQTSPSKHIIDKVRELHPTTTNRYSIGASNLEVDLRELFDKEGQMKLFVTLVWQNSGGVFVSYTDACRKCQKPNHKKQY